MTAGVIHLQDDPGYPLLLPNGMAASADTMQEIRVALGESPASLRASCSVTGTMFALTAPAVGDSWTMRSPSVTGWLDATTTGDFRDAWLAFVREFSVHERQGCFPAAGRMALQRVTEAIALPADEAVLFRYAFTGRGATELLPGMVVEAEHSYVRLKGGQRVLTSAVARYRVVSTDRGGVVLKKSLVENPKLAGESSILFHLDERTAGTAHVWLSLQTAAEGGAGHTSLLLFGDDAAALDRTSRAMEAAGTQECKAVTEPAVHCLAVDAAVSLLIECRLNGKPVVEPLGTTLGQMFDAKPAALATLTLRRRLTSGAWDAVEFPRRRDGAGRLVLMDGDEITTR